ncbi:MAG: hypothetical protein RLZZ241_530 [Bacteroidota bacterium]
MLRPGITDVFFDLDHTLWDFERNSAIAYSKLFQNHRIDLEINDFLQEYIPRNLEYWKLYREGKINKELLRYRRLRDVFDHLGYPVSDNAINLIAEDYIEILGEQTHLMPDALEILKYLKPQYRLHVITNGFEEVQQRKLKNSGIANYFLEVVPSERAGVQKPHPQIFKLAMDAARVAPENAIMIGDNLEADILGALATGMQAIHLNVHNDPAHNYCPIIYQLGEIKGKL